MNNRWTLDKPMVSLSTCHLNVLPLMAILLTLAKFFYILVCVANTGFPLVTSTEITSAQCEV